MTLSLSDSQHKRNNAECYYAECRILFTIMLNVCYAVVLSLSPTSTLVYRFRASLEPSLMKPLRMFHVKDGLQVCSWLEVLITAVNSFIVQGPCYAFKMPYFL